jgi:PEP-CTERM/exosortase A-associated glycosyltransferase
MKILHILDHYKPHFSGYVFRTSYILKYQKELGLEPIILTSPKHGDITAPLEEIDEMRVYRTSQNNFGNISFIKENRLMRALQTRIEEVVEKERPDIIHAHSPSLNGIPSVKVARKYDIPIVYEVRAFWEDAAVDHGSFKDGSLKYWLSKTIETALLNRVDAIFTICDGLRKEMIARGIINENITVIPNCVDPEIFAPREYDQELADKYGLKEKLVLGFIGSFYHYEGLDILIDSFSRVSQSNNNIQLILVGDGPEKEQLYKKVERHGLLDDVIFTGKIPHEQITRYYSLMDILIYPRKKMRLTEFVTPLKPLEAMAMEKVVVGSDVGGMKELISHNENGFLFKAGDIQSLQNLLSEIMRDTKHFIDISKAGKETILNKHLWGAAVEKYLTTYEKLLVMKEKPTVASNNTT